MKAKILDLGCGKRKTLGAIGVDIGNDTDADVKHNLNLFPYPFSDNEFDFINCDNIMEHLDDVIRVMEELWRIIKAGGTVKIVVPYFRSKWAFIDPTHKHFFTMDSFSYFDPRHIHHRIYHYSDVTFHIEKIIFDENIKHRHSLFWKLFVKIINKKSHFYEMHLSALFPLNTLTFYLKAIKKL